MSEEAEAADVPVETDAPAVEEKKEEVAYDPQSALQAVLKTSLAYDHLARGLHDAVKAMDRREAHLCVLSNSCNEPAYTKLITALGKEHDIPIIKAPDSKTLGEWAGLCKYNSEGKAVKVVGCSCVVVKKWGEETAALRYLKEHLKTLSA
eukprot:g65644.t1